MTTPQPIKQVALVSGSENESARTIRLYATDEMVAYIRANGYGRLAQDDVTGTWELTVSPLYHYHQVIDWLRDQELAA